MTSRPEDQSTREKTDQDRAYDARAEEATGNRRSSGAATATAEGELFSQSGAEDYSARWEQIQTAFVDDPRSTVADADALVRDVINELTLTFERERNSLEAQWDQDAEPDTETLRVALQRYRAFFQRLLSR